MGFHREVAAARALGFVAVIGASLVLLPTPSGAQAPLFCSGSGVRCDDPQGSCCDNKCLLLNGGPCCDFSLGETACGSRCAPYNGRCCGDGPTFCFNYIQKCCPGGGCAPFNAVCCDDGQHYCDYGEKCCPGGGCVRASGSCSSGTNSVPSPTTTPSPPVSPPTPTPTSTPPPTPPPSTPSPTPPPSTPSPTPPPSTPSPTPPPSTPSPTPPPSTPSPTSTPEPSTPSPTPPPSTPAPTDATPGPSGTPAPTPTNPTPAPTSTEEPPEAPDGPSDGPESPTPTPTPTPTSTPTPSPATNSSVVCETFCRTLGGIRNFNVATSTNCTCLYPVIVRCRLADKNLSDWDPAFRTLFTADVASRLQVQPAQIGYTSVQQGSILLDAYVTPQTGAVFDNVTASRITAVLGRPLNLSSETYGRVEVTSVVIPTVLQPGAPPTSSPSVGSGVGIGPVAPPVQPSAPAVPPTSGVFGEPKGSIFVSFCILVTTLYGFLSATMY